MGLETIPATRPTMRVTTAVIRARLNVTPPLLVDTVEEFVTVMVCVEVTVVAGGAEDETPVVVVIGEMEDWSDTVRVYQRETDFRSDDSPIRPCQTAIAM